MTWEAKRGDRALFRYSGDLGEAARLVGADGRPGDPIVSRYSGQVGTVAAPIEDVDDESKPMYRVRFDDGYEGDAFGDELDIVREAVSCDAHCGAFDDPASPEEYRAAYEHWRGHAWLFGCAHGR